MGEMSFVLYRSQADLRDGSAEQAAMVAQAQANNARDSLTGALYRESDYFFQWFEGPKSSCDSLLARLRVDPRHHDIHVLGAGPLAARLFPDWRMVLLARGADSLFDHIALHGKAGANGDALAIRDFLLERAVGLAAS